MLKQMKERVYHLTSAVCSEAEYSKINIKDEYKTAQAGTKYFRVFAGGFVKNGKTIKVFSKRPTNKVRSGKRYLPSKNENDSGVQYHYSRKFHFKIFNNAYSYLSAFFWYLNPKNCSKNDIVFLDPLNVSISMGTIAACRIRKIPTIAYITDVPGCYCFSGGKKMSRAMRTSQKANQSVDGYINITSQIDGLLNKSGKPSITVEGFVSEIMQDKANTLDGKYSKKVVMYTGAIEKIYGLDMLVEGFLKADVPDSELHFYGAGKYVQEIVEISKQDDRIKYMGCKDNSYVVDEQLKATLLVNPRYSNEEYTKYSFPSKNLEYAASGTPTLTTNLPGMPEEYKSYVYILRDESVDGMAQRLKEILSMPKEELHEFGLAAKKWVLENKNSKSQIKKIIDFTDKYFRREKGN